ncbi:hypothetical protein SNE40_005001 [Patella caerulea]|uniref:Uncharacterized protein n=1 Tax=Patella caerulea TaxID=87958 RepID=A0AAN8KB08_PATCE
MSAMNGLHVLGVRVILITTLLLPFVFAKQLECLGQWQAIHRACYRFDEIPKTWQAASDSCREDGGELMSISSRVEFMKIKKAVQARINKEQMLTWWVGLKRNNETRRFDKWIDGGMFSARVTRWSPGEPNNRRQKENCAEFKFDGKLNDKDCTMERPFVCELVEITQRPTIQTTAQATTEASTTKATTILTTTAGEITSPKPNTQPDTTLTTKKLPVVVEEVGEDPTSTSATFKPIPQEEEEDLSIYKDCFDYDKIVKSRKKNKMSSNMIHFDTSNTCPSMVASEISWPNTEGGQVAVMQCKRGTGKATFTCGQNPTCWRATPDVSGCASQKFQQIFKKAKKIFATKNRTTSEVEAPQEFSVNETLVVSETLAQITEKETVSVADVILTSQVMAKLGKTKFTKGPGNKKEFKKIFKNVVKTGSNLVSHNKSSTWSGMNANDKARCATGLLVAMESATVSMAHSIDYPVSIETHDENIDMQLRVINVSSEDTQPMVYEEGKSDVKFSIPKETLQKLSKGGLAKAVFMTHYKMADILDERSPEETDENVIQPKIASYIFSATLDGNDHSRLPEPITFTMKHVHSFSSNSVPLCSFLNMSGAVGTWSQDGCQVVSTDAGETTCQCDHLTNFAILMDVQGVEMTDVHSFMLRFITIVGCVISLVCLFICFLTFNWFSAIQGERNSIHKNLVFCLFVAELLFLVGIDKTGDKLTCGLVAGFLHYFFLTAFTWMLLEGLHIVCMLVQVFDASKSRLPYYYFVGYGFPLAIIAVSAGVFYQGYGTDRFCWLTTERYFIWSFAGPVAVVLLVNAVILVYAMSTVCRHSEYVFNSKEKPSSGDNMRAWIQGAMAIEVILGLTWVFGYCFISQETIALAYIFTILNSLQGLFIFCFHCILNKKVIKEYKRIFHITKRPASSTQTASLMRKQGTSYEMSNPSHSHSLTNSNAESKA